MKWFWLLLPRHLRPTEADHAAAAKADAERKLRAAKREWPKVEAAREDFASWLDSALRQR